MYKTKFLKKISNTTDWHKKWAANNFSILGSSFNSLGYKSMSKRFGSGLLYNFYLYEQKAVTCFQSNKENEAVGLTVANNIKRNKKYAKNLSDELLEKTKKLRILFKKPSSNLFDLNNFLTFTEQWSEIMAPFVAVSRCGNFLTEKNNAKNLNVIEKVRVKTDSILIEANNYIEKFTLEIAKKEKIRNINLSVLSYSELHSYVNTGTLPKLKVLKSRSAGCGYVSLLNKDFFLSHKDSKFLAKLITGKFKVTPGYAKGRQAFPGLVVGQARIFQNPKNIKSFKKGSIIITGMTRPEFIPLIKKCGAVVTDAGGILCHAAIISRELGIPCIIGTQTATSAFKDGDMVEVDANIGIIKKI